MDNLITEKNDYDAISVFIYSKIDKTLLDKLQNLTYIQTLSAEYEHIDIVECYKREIFVSNAKGYAGSTVWEFELGLLLKVLRRIMQICLDNIENFLNKKEGKIKKEKKWKSFLALKV